MCFNGATTWQLGWFTSLHVDLPIGDAFNWKGNLVGFAEKAYATNSDRMIIRIRSSTDYYDHFNRQIGMNAGTREGGDTVLVSSREPGTEFAQSYLLAKLGIGGVFTVATVPQFNNGSTESLNISVTALNTNTIPAKAAVSVQFRFLNVTPPPSPSTKPTPKPSPKPTPKPTVIKKMKRR